MLPLLAALAFGCEDGLTSAAVDEGLTRAEEAFGRFDAEAFASEVDQTRAALPCLAEPIAPPTAARLHRLEGLRQFLERDEGAAQAHFAVAKRLDGAYTWPTSLLPARHQVREVYDAAVEQGASAELAAPAAGALYLDGQADRIRVDGSPTVFQHLGGDAAQTVFVGPSQALPEYALPAPPAPEPIPAPVVSTTTHKARPPVAGVSLVASGVVLGAVAGVQFARSRAGYTEYLDAFDQDPLAAEASFQRTVASPRNQAAGFGAGAAVLLGAGGVLFARGIHVEGRF